MKFFAAVVNTYGKVGQEFEDFAAVVENNSPGKRRGRALVSLLSLLGVYANAEKVLLSHAPSQKRAQSGEVLAAMKAKGAEAARAAPDTPARAAPVPAPQRNATQQNAPKGVSRYCTDIRGEVTCTDGKWHVYCKDKKCQKPIPYANWSYHCKKHHADIVPQTQDSSDGNDDAVQPGQRAVGVGDGSKEPKRRGYVQRKNHGTHDAKAADSSNGKVAPKKSKVAPPPPKKSQPEQLL